MERWYHVNIRWYIMSLWTLVVILLMLPQFSESACAVSNCNISSYCIGYTCKGCNDGFYLQSGSCIQCPDRCSTCTSSTQCTTCKDTYWNVYNRCSSYCSDYCLDRHCDVSTGFCYTCITGKYGPQCEQDCNLCKDGKCDLRKCTNGCKDGYYQDNAISGYSYCLKCVYDNCLTCSNGTYCTQCEQGYYRKYYRHQQSGNGYMSCLQCYDTCLDCTSTEYCHEDCIQYCSEPVNPGTIRSTHKPTTTSRTATKTPSTSNDQNTSTQPTNHSSENQEEPNQPDTLDPKTIISSKPPDKLQTDSSVQKADDNSSTIIGAAAGGGTVVVIAIVVILVVCFKKLRKTKQHKHADQNLEGHHEYVNTNMTDILSTTSSENNDENNDIHTVSSDLTNTGVSNIDSSTDYFMLGDRPTHESDYTDLQTT